MNTKKIHYISGLMISVFAAMHLFNHCFSMSGAEKHIQVMTLLRHFYRNVFIEKILLLAVAVQIYSGFKLFIKKKRNTKTLFERLHIWTGLYLALFFVIHLSAVLAGRFILHLDTNFYFGAAGLNAFPYNLFFIPYYFLAVASLFIHIAAIHNQRMKKNILGFSPLKQSFLISTIGICFAAFLIYALSNRFERFQIPAEYNILMGK